MNDRDCLAADLDEWLSAADDEWTVGEAADFLIALGWTRLDEERLARALHENPSHEWGIDDEGDHHPDSTWCMEAERQQAAAIAKAYRDDHE